jgi:hypothetical protein
MIEQTELVVTQWEYHPPKGPVAEQDPISNEVTFQVQKKRNAIKKGIALRFSTRFIFENIMVLEYTGEDSYVIDFADTIDRTELLRMISNSFSKFKDKFDLRKLNTVLYNRSISPLNEELMDLDPVLELLQ